MNTRKYSFEFSYKTMCPYCDYIFSEIVDERDKEKVEAFKHSVNIHISKCNKKDNATKRGKKKS